MHTFAQKPKAPNQTTSAKPTIPGRAHFGQSREVNSILHLQRTIGNQAVQRMLQTHATHVPGPGRPLPDGARSFFERRFGHDLGHVRIHTGETADISARALGARAFTAGHDISFRQGAYQPESADGRNLLAHEVAHVVQNARNGTVRRVSRPGDSAEVEADHVAARISAGAESGPLRAAAPEISRQPTPGKEYVELEITPGEGGTYTINVADPKANPKWIDTALIAAGYNIYLGGFRIWLTGMKVSEWDVGIDIPSSDIDFVTSQARAINNFVYNSRAEARDAVAKTPKRAGDPLLFAYYWGAGGMVLVPTTICPATAPRATATMWKARQDYVKFVRHALAGVAAGIVVGRVLGELYSWARGGGGGKGEIKPQGKGDKPPVQPKPGSSKSEPPKPEPLKTEPPKTEPPKPATTGTQLPKSGPELISQTAKVPGGQAEKVKFFETHKKALEPGWVANKTGTATDGSVVYHGEDQAKALVITKDGRVFTGTWGKHVKAKFDETGGSLTCDWSLPEWKQW